MCIRDRVKRVHHLLEMKMSTSQTIDRGEISKVLIITKAADSQNPIDFSIDKLRSNLYSMESGGSDQHGRRSTDPFQLSLAVSEEERKSRPDCQDSRNPSPRVTSLEPRSPIYKDASSTPKNHQTIKASTFASQCIPAKSPFYEDRRTKEQNDCSDIMDEIETESISSKLQKLQVEWSPSRRIPAGLNDLS
eukprot:TRINITY_DN23437_c0_g1_i1.p1 TRINITY_DN23437_c0_g1~~TRINITY_DN23437_c0_g1_i1.p1  ORF type:complete len:206 (-),score=29.17 TRINITY_DN23437_c0_g1_i1:29-601(-)